MLILSRGCRKLDEACAGRCEGKGWRHDCQRANYNVFFFWGFYFQQHFFVFSSALPMPRDCLMYLFYFSLLFFFNQAWIRGKRKYTNERTDNEWNAIPTALQNKQIQPVFFFFFLLFCFVCAFYFSHLLLLLLYVPFLYFFFSSFLFSSIPTP